MKNNPKKKIWEFSRDTESITNLHNEELNLSTGQLDLSTEQLDNFNETLQLVEAIARHFAANHIMLLPTSKIKELTGGRPSKSHFQRGTFIFTKEEDIKIGREKAWRVQMTPNAFRPTT